MAKLLYACGQNRFAAKKTATFIFGDYFRRLVVDDKERMFYIVVNEYIEDKETGEKFYFKDTFNKEYREFFKEFWGKVPGFEIRVVKVTEEVNIDEEEEVNSN